jgi:hypothetical protein
MVQLTTEQRTFVIKTFYETNTLQQTRIAFGLTLNILLMCFQFHATVEECDFDRQFLFDEYVAISHRYGLKKVS